MRAAASTTGHGEDRFCFIHAGGKRSLSPQNANSASSFPGGWTETVGRGRGPRAGNTASVAFPRRPAHVLRCRLSKGLRFTRQTGLRRFPEMGMQKIYWVQLTNINLHQTGVGGRVWTGVPAAVSGGVYFAVASQVRRLVPECTARESGPRSARTGGCFRDLSPSRQREARGRKWSAPRTCLSPAARPSVTGGPVPSTVL